jgi:transketolase
VGKRYESYGWHVNTVLDGDRDLVGIENAIHAARRVTDKPSLIIVKYIIIYSHTLLYENDVAVLMDA